MAAAHGNVQRPITEALELEVIFSDRRGECPRPDEFIISLHIHKDPNLSPAQRKRQRTSYRPFKSVSRVRNSRLRSKPRAGFELKLISVPFVGFAHCSLRFEFVITKSQLHRACRQAAKATLAKALQSGRASLSAAAAPFSIIPICQAFSYF